MALNVEMLQRRALGSFAGLSWFAAARGVLFAVILIELAVIFWTAVTPGNAFGPWRTQSVQQADGIAAPAIDPFGRLGNVADQPAVVTPLQLTLFGTRMNDATGRGSAIIAGPDGVQANYSIGDQILPGAQLKSVAFDHVVIDRGGSVETLYIDQSTGGAANGVAAPFSPGAGSTVGVASPTRSGDTPLSVAAIRAGIGFIPQIDAGRITGLSVRPQGDGTVFRQIGLRPGDIITRINGKPITAAGDLDAASAGTTTTLTVMRGNETLPLTVNLAAK